MELPPKGEFYCKYRQEWLPEVPSEFSDDVGRERLTGE
jgi:hypothetical protein